MTVCKFTSVGQSSFSNYGSAVFISVVRFILSRFVVIRKSFTGFIVFCFARIEFTRRIQRVIGKGFRYVSFIVVNGFLNGFTFRNFFPFDIGFLTNDISRIIVIVFRMAYKRLSFTVCYQSVLLYNKRSQKLSNDLLLLSD